VIGETELFETMIQLNQLICKMIHSLETPHTGDACWSKRCKCNKNSAKTWI